ncbi:MAG: rhodanese-like domain-containing protein [bacterium]
MHRSLILGSLVWLGLTLPMLAQSGGDFGGSFDDPGGAAQQPLPPPVPPPPAGGETAAPAAAPAAGGDFGGSFGDGAFPATDPGVPAAGTNPPPPPPPTGTAPPPPPPGGAPAAIGGGDFGDGGSFDPGDGSGVTPQPPLAPAVQPAPPPPPPPPPPQPAPALQPQATGPVIDPQIAAFELRDFGVAPVQTLRSGQFHAPTPTAVPGAQTVTTEALVTALTGGMQLVVIDVLGNNYSLPNAYMAPELASPGSFNDRTQQRAGQWLGQITAGNFAAPVVIYCSGPECWLSYNAVLRTVAAGYTNVYWYRGGLEAWQMAGLQLSPASF